MRKTKIWLLGLGVALPLLTAQAEDAPVGAKAETPAPAARPPAPAPVTEEYLRQLQRKLETIKTVQADFQEDKKLKVFARTMTLRGQLALERPGRLTWRVIEPVRYMIRIQGEEVSQWDEDTQKVQVLHLDADPTFKAMFAQFQAWFLGNFQSLARDYEVTLLQQEPLTLRFKPKADSVMARAVAQVDLTFGQDQTHIDTLTILEGMGDTTTIRFAKVRLNETIAAETWTIPPEIPSHGF